MFATTTGQQEQEDDNGFGAFTSTSTAQQQQTEPQHRLSRNDDGDAAFPAFSSAPQPQTTAAAGAQQQQQQQERAQPFGDDFGAFADIASEEQQQQQQQQQVWKKHTDGDDDFGNDDAFGAFSAPQPTSQVAEPQFAAFDTHFDASGPVFEQQQQLQHQPDMTQDAAVGAVGGTSGAATLSPSTADDGSASAVIEDVYAAFRDLELTPDVQTTTLKSEAANTQRAREVWTKILKAARVELQTALTALERLSTLDDVDTVKEQKQFTDFVAGVREMIGVAERIASASERKLPPTPTEQASEEEQDSVEVLRSSVRALISNMRNLAASLSIQELRKPSEDNESPMTGTVCAICLHETQVASPLLGVLASPTSSSSSASANGFTMNGCDYHGTCANFWCNCVEAMLPALDV